MFIQSGLFTSESVTEGHPDKLADRISDAVLDEFRALEPALRGRCDTVLTSAGAIITGEFKTKDTRGVQLLYAKGGPIVRSVLHDAGYRSRADGIAPDRYPVESRFNWQSSDLGAALVYGYATNETPELIPAPVLWANAIVRRQSEQRRSGALPWLGPDARAQVTVRYQDGYPVEVDSVTLTTQHTDDVDLDTVRAKVEGQVIDVIIPKNLRSDNFRASVNPGGRFVIGESGIGVGITGRHVAADTYGGAVPNGSVRLSGEDPFSIGRCGTYMARYLARLAVARGWAKRCCIQIAYAAGIADPVSFLVQTEGAHAERDTDIAAALRRDFDLSCTGIANTLALNELKYYPLAAYGQFGRDDVPWEQEEHCIPFCGLDLAAPKLPAGLPEATRLIEPAWGTIAPRSPKRFPYLVVHLMAGFYQREEIAIQKGEAAVHIGHRDTFVHHPEPFNSDGTLGHECRQSLIAGTLEAIRRTGFRMCLVWSPNRCTYVEKDGLVKESGEPPSGGVGSGGVGGARLPPDLEFDRKVKRSN